MSRFGTAIGLLRSLAIYHGQPWRNRALRRFYGELLEPGALAFDVGAHVGNRTRALRANRVRCVALEPQPVFARLLARLFGRDAGTVLVVSAVGRESGRATLRMASRHPTVSTLSSDWIDTVGPTAGFAHVRWDATIEVPVTTLDALIAAHGLPDFCKIDVEGLEPDILDGLSRAIPLVAVEYLPAAPALTEACIERLDALGDYVYNLSSGESHALTLDAWVGSRDIRASLGRACTTGASGDLYARLRAPESGARLRAVRLGTAPIQQRHDEPRQAARE